MTTPKNGHDVTIHLKKKFAMSKIYIGKVAARTGEKDLEDIFSKYGTIRRVTMKHTFAFVVGTELMTHFSPGIQQP
jgi:hypothetical protein